MAGDSIITTIIKPFKLNGVCEAVAEVGIRNITVTAVKSSLHDYSATLQSLFRSDKYQFMVRTYRQRPIDGIVPSAIRQ